jgi:transposase-like protein
MPPRGREYPPEAVWQAQELYCVARLTFAQVADETGVAASTLKRWSEKNDWRGKREKLAQAEADLRADTILARSAMLKKLIVSKDAQTGFAVSALESLALRQAEAARAQKLMNAAKQHELRPIRTQEDAVAALAEAVELKLNRLLHSPEDVDFRAVQDVQKAMELVAELQGSVGKGNDDGRGVQSRNIEAMLDAMR